MNLPVTPTLGGVVLAGGESRRMGCDKAALSWNGQPLWQRQVHVLRDAGAEPVAVGRRRGQSQLSDQVPHLWDQVENVGPLAGLHAALSAATTMWVAMLAVDLPALEASWFLRLRGFCQNDVGAVVRHPGGFEPLAAIYPRSALPVVVEQLRHENYSLQNLLTVLTREGRMMAVDVSPDECSQLANSNAPEEFARVSFRSDREHAQHLARLTNAVVGDSLIPPRPADEKQKLFFS